MKGFKIPKSLLLGSATAATQIEGGDLHNNWYFWSLQGKVGNGESSFSGADHYRLFEQDIDLMEKLGHQCYRMSIEWSRIEPRRGEWSQEAIEHYRKEFSLLRAKGILPLVTLHHFSCPQWFQKSGGWIAKDSVAEFLRFCTKAVEEFGDLVNEWCTINEPNVFAHYSYMEGNFPPGHSGDIKSYFIASRNLVLAHIKAYDLIHSIREKKQFQGKTMVGFAHHLAYFETSRPGALAAFGRNLVNWLFHEIYFKGFVEGKLAMPLGLGYPAGKGTYCDFIGINYYSRLIITPSLNPYKLFESIDYDPEIPSRQKNDLGWEIFPKGMTELVQNCWNRYQIPIYITENGIPDAGDTKRTAFIRDHLKEVVTLIDRGVDLRRYYYWSLMDNLEWNDGYGPRFGLIEVDYNTMERKVRASGDFYAEICRTGYVKGVEDAG